ncbi:MAG: hypothetical protein RLY21_605 [Planctomycetota bacterium]|jgi:hypothetical protein
MFAMKMSRFRCTTILGLVGSMVLASLGSAASGSQLTTARSDAARATLVSFASFEHVCQVKVVDSRTGRPIRGATVTGHFVSAYPGYPQFGALRSAVTDANGNATIRGPRSPYSHSWELRATAPGYHLARVGLNPFWPTSNVRIAAVRR